jgi:hypothetical protein
MVPSEKPERSNDMTSILTNVHPADELYDLRAKIKVLQERETELRDVLLAGNDASREGAEYRAFVIPSVRETLDKNAITLALGKDVIEPFLKKSEVKTLKLAKKET